MTTKLCFDFYIPRFNNDKREFDHATMEQIKVDLIDAFGGLTVLPYSSGYWKDGDGKVVTDEISIHRVVTDDSMYEYHKVRDLHAKLRDLLQQDQLFIVSYGVDVEECPKQAVEEFNRSN